MPREANESRRICTTKDLNGPQIARIQLKNLLKGSLSPPPLSLKKKRLTEPRNGFHEAGAVFLFIGEIHKGLPQRHVTGVLCDGSLKRRQIGHGKIRRGVRGEEKKIHRPLPT